MLRVVNELSRFWIEVLISFNEFVNVSVLLVNVPTSVVNELTSEDTDCKSELNKLTSLDTVSTVLPKDVTLVEIEFTF